MTPRLSAFATLAAALLAAAAPAASQPRLARVPAPLVTPGALPPALRVLPAPPKPPPLAPARIIQAFGQLAPGALPPTVGQKVQLTPDAPATASAYLSLGEASVSAEPGHGSALIKPIGWAQVSFKPLGQKTYLIDCAVDPREGGATQAKYYVNGAGISGPGGQAYIQGMAPIAQGHVLIAAPPGSPDDTTRAQVVFWPYETKIDWYFYGCDVIPAG